ncbi:MAG: IS30 family transposase, partial [Streptococcus infantarius]
NSLTTEELNHYVSAINDRPRRLHKYKTANILFGIDQTA